MGYYLLLLTIGLLQVCYTEAICGNYSTTTTNDKKVQSNHAETAKVADIMMSACQDYCISQLDSTDCVISYIPNDEGFPNGTGECSYYTNNCGGGCSTESNNPGIVVVFSCTAFACDSLSSPVNGLVNVPGTPITNVVATYSCDAGYVISGSATSTCDATGSWSNASPVCNLVDCGGGLSNPVNGIVTLPSSTLYGDQATYSCDNGYILNGASTITCGANGNWDAPEPTCVIAACDSLSSPVNGWVNVSGTPVTGDIATYSCDAGHVISGSATSTCDATGSWSNASPVCNLVDCGGGLSNPVNGMVTLPSSTLYGDQATYSCEDGYILNGASTITCVTNGNWDAPEPTCVILGSTLCQAFLQSPRSKVMVKSYSDVLPGFSLLQTATVVNYMKCVRMCMNQLQDACEQPNACLMAKYDVISDTCDMYYSDTNGNNVTCNATSQCYTYEYYTYFM